MYVLASHVIDQSHLPVGDDVVYEGQCGCDMNTVSAEEAAAKAGYQNNE